jgi:exosortase
MPRTDSGARFADARVQSLTAWLLIAAGFAVLYGQVAAGLVRAWNTDDNYSHGFLIVPLAAYFAWRRRRQIASAPLHPSMAGLAVIGSSVLLFAAGMLGSELFLTRISLVGTTAGIVLFLFGWSRLRALAFPLALLLLMIPLPAILFNEIAFPLQLIASRAGELALHAAAVPAIREGNVLVLPHVTLEVAQACSGIRSLISLLTFAIVFGAEHTGWVRAATALAAIPIAVVANGARVAGTGIAAHYWGAQAAEGFFHHTSGWAVFLVAMGLVIGIQALLVRLAPATGGPRQVEARC